MAEIFGVQWAITPEALTGILTAVKGEGDTLDRDAFHGNDQIVHKSAGAFLGDPAEGAKLTRIKGSTGVLFLEGPLVPRADNFVEASGIVSTERLTSEFRALSENAAIKDILIVVDSPGGAVTGIAELAETIAGCDKKVTAYVTGMAASAAYWIASAADEMIASPTATAGSIGTILTVRVKKDEDTVEIVSTQSPNKRVDATTDEGREKLQTLADDMAEVFVDTVAKNRNVTSAKVLSDFGRGDIMIASKAAAVNMIDKIGTLSDTMDSIGSGVKSRRSRAWRAGKAQPRREKQLTFG
jgi:signal peptide peptidase SppA